MNLDPASRIPDDIHLLIAQLMETDPGNDRIRDIRFALEIADARRAEHRARREAARDVHGGDTDFWRRCATNHIPYDELQRRRSQPGPMAGGAAA